MQMVGLSIEESIAAAIDGIAKQYGKSRSEVMRSMLYGGLFRWRYRGETAFHPVPTCPGLFKGQEDYRLYQGKWVRVDDWGLIPAEANIPLERAIPVAKSKKPPKHMVEWPAFPHKPEGDDEPENDHTGAVMTWEQMMARSVPAKKVEP